MSDIQNDIDYVIDLMENVIHDHAVPKNIRGNVEQARDELKSEKEDSHKITSAIYFLDDISNDINMPSHTRTDIWTIMSELESLKEKIK